MPLKICLDSNHVFHWPFSLSKLLADPSLIELGENKTNKTHKHPSLASMLTRHVSSAEQGLMKPANNKEHAKRRQSTQFISLPGPHFQSTCTYLFSHKVCAGAVCLGDSALACLSNFLAEEKGYWAAIRGVRATADQVQWMVSNWFITIPPWWGQEAWFKLWGPCELSVCTRSW